MSTGSAALESAPGHRPPPTSTGDPGHGFARSRDGLLDALAQVDHLVARLEQSGVDPLGATLAGAVVARLDELLDTGFTEQERRLFAAFQRDGDASTRQAVDRLRLDHAWITANWWDLRPMLDSLARGYCWVDIDALRDAADVFRTLVKDHVAQEGALLEKSAGHRP